MRIKATFAFANPGNVCQIGEDRLVCQIGEDRLFVINAECFKILRIDVASQSFVNERAADRLPFEFEDNDLASYRDEFVFVTGCGADSRGAMRYQLNPGAW